MGECKGPIMRKELSFMEVHGSADDGGARLHGRTQDK